jgi:DNA-binding SARP family transcriptional activator
MGRTVVAMEGKPAAALVIRVLGPLTVIRDGVAVALPPSRKVRALLAWLVLGPQPVSRSRLCDLLWDAPNDPRGELRWCLSKLRGVLDDPDRRRVVTRDELVALDLADCRVDALEIDRAVQAGLDHAEPSRLAELCELFGGDLLDGVQLDNPEVSGWLAAQRNRYRTAQNPSRCRCTRSAASARGRRAGGENPTR